MGIEKLSILEEEILKLLEEKNKNLSYRQIKRYTHSINEEKKKQLDEALSHLETEGYIYLNDYDEYQLFSKCSELAIGELKCSSKNKAYIVVGRNNIFIPDSHLNGAIAGDIVIVRRNNFKVQGNSRGEVDKILKRKKGKLIFDYSNGEFTPYNWPAKIEINIPQSQKEKLFEGSRVLINLSLDKSDNKYNGKIISIIGHKDDPNLDVKTIVSNNGIVIDFSEEALEQARQINTYVTQEEIDERLKNGGIDLRDKTIFTIDGAHTKDIDDAVSIEMDEEGNYILGVHIADVSHYVMEDSVLDLEARQRSTSVYPYDCVIPMLPHELSNGICSLNPNVDRLALSCIMKIDKEGNLLSFDIKDSIINSKKKMEYEKINDIFERKILYSDYIPFIDDLSMMINLSKLLNKVKNTRGYISFGDDDVEFKDENGIAIDVIKKRRGLAEKMIENFMLLANETISSFYYWLEMPGIYRNHPVPNADSIRQIINLLGLHIHIPNNIDNPRVLQNIVNKIRIFDEGGIYTELLLQSMKRAYYSPVNIGHFGLALNYYTHFTSPIRRYPDLQTHRIIRKVRDNIMNIDFDETNKKLMQICSIASTKERIADKAEKETNYYKMAEYMEQHIGQTFTGYITYISHNGISVKTEDLICGKISMESLRYEGFSFNEQNMTITNSGKNITLYIGDKINIKVKSASKETCKIEFIFEEKLEKEKVMLLAQ